MHEKNKASKENEEKMKRLEKLLLKKSQPVSLLEEPENMLLESPPEDVLLHWQAPEFEIYERDKKWYFYVTIGLVLIIGWAIYSNGLVMAITFILIGVVGYIHISRIPRILDFVITDEGIYIGKRLFSYSGMHSFWIIYEPGEKKIISFHTKNSFLPFLRVPIHDEDPVKIREALIQFIPEIKQEPNMIDSLERILKI